MTGERITYREQDADARTEASILGKSSDELRVELSGNTKAITELDEETRRINARLDEISLIRSALTARRQVLIEAIRPSE